MLREKTTEENDEQSQTHLTAEISSNSNNENNAEIPVGNNKDNDSGESDNDKDTKSQSAKPNKRVISMIICLYSNGTWVPLKNEKDMHEAYISKLTKDKNLQVVEAKVLSPKTNTSWG